MEDGFLARIGREDGSKSDEGMGWRGQMGRRPMFLDDVCTIDITNLPASSAKESDDQDLVQEVKASRPAEASTSEAYLQATSAVEPAFPVADAAQKSKPEGIEYNSRCRLVRHGRSLIANPFLPSNCTCWFSCHAYLHGKRCLLASFWSRSCCRDRIRSAMIHLVNLM